MNLSREMAQGMPASGARKPTVFIVDDCAEGRESLRLLVQSGGLEARTYGSAHEFLAEYSPEVAGCVVVDVRMPGMSGLELQQKLLELDSDLPIIMVTGYGEVSMAVQAIKAGALDFICKPYSPQALLDRVQQALCKHTEQRTRRTQSAQLKARVATLSRREHEVANLLADGNSTKGIAKILGISPKTVDNHRAKVLDKLRVESPVALRKLLIS